MHNRIVQCYLSFGEGGGEANPDVVVRKSVQDAGLFAVLQQDGTRLPLIYIIMCTQLFVAQREKLLTAFMFLLWRHLARYLQSLCAWAFAVAEYVELADGQGLHEVVCLGKQLVCLASHSHNDIYAYEGIGDVSSHLCYLLCKELRVVATMHEAQHFVTSALQGNMKVRHEGAALAAEPDDFLCEQVWLYAADAVALDAFHLVEGTKQVDERLASCLTEVPDVDAGQHDFLAPFPGSLFCLFDK